MRHIVSSFASTETLRHHRARLFAVRGWGTQLTNWQCLGGSPMFQVSWTESTHPGTSPRNLEPSPGTSHTDRNRLSVSRKYETGKALVVDIKQMLTPDRVSVNSATRPLIVRLPGAPSVARSSHASYAPRVSRQQPPRSLRWKTRPSKLKGIYRPAKGRRTALLGR
jgi:hypothetical protein